MVQVGPQTLSWKDVLNFFSSHMYRVEKYLAKMSNE
jgi:hypothetical protein